MVQTVRDLCWKATWLDLSIAPTENARFCADGRWCRDDGCLRGYSNGMRALSLHRRRLENPAIPLVASESQSSPSRFSQQIQHCLNTCVCPPGHEIHFFSFLQTTYGNNRFASRGRLPLETCCTRRCKTVVLRCIKVGGHDETSQERRGFRFIDRSSHFRLCLCHRDVSKPLAHFLSSLQLTHFCRIQLLLRTDFLHKCTAQFCTVQCRDSLFTKLYSTRHCGVSR